MSLEVFANVIYDIEHPENSYIETNIKKDLVSDFISDFIRTQIGAGEDKCKAIEIDVYHINITCDMSCDSFSCDHDTGNKGLREGILMDVVSRLTNKEIQINPNRKK